MLLEEIKTVQIQQLRDDLLKEQGGRCGICGCLLDESSGISLDHQHMTKKETAGKDGAGLIRGVLCRACNVMEGKVWNNMSRYIQPKSVQDRIDFLEKLILYYKKDNYPIIHPSEIAKEPKLKKSSYNKLKKVYNKKAKFPEYPKSKKLTKKLRELFSEFNLEPDFY